MKRTISIVIILMLAVVALPPWALAQQSTPPPAAPAALKAAEGDQGAGKHEGHHMAGSGPMQQGMSEKHKEMMAKRDQMMADMKAMDARLDEKVAVMNGAKGDERLAAMAAVINELVAQRKSMHEKFGEMRHWKMGCMMEHMGEHGKMGGKSGECPMMHQPGGKEHQETPGDKVKKDEPK